MKEVLVFTDLIFFPAFWILEVLGGPAGIFPVNWYILISAVTGCVIQEFIYWFELRHQIARGQAPPELTSTPYWIITICSILVFSLGSYFYFALNENRADLNFFTIAIFSAGFPRLFKGAVQQLGATPEKSRNKTFTAEPERKFGIKDYLMMRSDKR
ncbi:hypothetical protein GCM10007103_15970 [Salinimicrobium marinum]|uniref:Uncharacterized protein n=1 Tax=Salinimicrobium marinum TaxID=680283 RepID=A0A918SEP6_9FLAO|nr:hypothetical protein [Salinimicrobium marinum]GHA35228.1 hypothetical protein GCM10007103_15970 [Salinimicrobium marinum]